jgi:DNA-directed RNA polymerase specialized sigma subunit
MSDDLKSLSRGELLKHLRATYPEGVKRALALQKEQKQVQSEIVKTLREKACTVPEVAAAVHIPPQQTLWYLAAMRKYNLVIENGMSGDYPLFELAEEH